MLTLTQNTSVPTVCFIVKKFSIYMYLHQMCIVIQEVEVDGVANKDGRLQSGDQLLEVNGIDLTNAVHSEAREALQQPYPVCRLTVYREKAESNQSEKEGIIKKMIIL